MKTIEYYMNLPYRLELVPDTDEGGFVASYPELRGCLTSGETAEAALKNALDCKREWLAAALEDGYEIPEPTSDDEYSGQFKLRLPKSLHRALAENSKREGISMNQYCLYLLSKNDVLYAAVHYRNGVIPNENEIKATCNYAGYKEEQEKPLPKFKYYNRMMAELRKVLDEEIEPLMRTA